MECKGEFAKELRLMIENEHLFIDIKVYSVKYKVPSEWNKLAIHDVTGRWSRGDINLKNKNDCKIEYGDWHYL